MKTDHIALQDLAMRIYKMEPPAPQSAQADSSEAEYAKLGRAMYQMTTTVHSPLIPFGEQCDLIPHVWQKFMDEHTAPPSREWQDLSPLEMRDTLRNCAASTFDKLAPNWYEVRQFARAIESALRAKNTGEQA
jgi:hypothetical protein